MLLCQTRPLPLESFTEQIDQARPFFAFVIVSSQPCESVPLKQLAYLSSSHMSNRVALTIATAALLLALLPSVAAHGAENMDMGAPEASQPQTDEDGRPRSYWSLSEHATLMYWHIALEILAWVVVLPVGEL
jgi:hypothetical protein